ncbi:MAG: hypothetical protein ACJAZP_000223 [Psychromonas sp.]|jgi:hypothetical protein
MNINGFGDLLCTGFNLLLILKIIILKTIVLKN